jgi:predicted 2-oxoglutarate/Fe(II)-dependent dioxygenase YbiX
MPEYNWISEEIFTVAEFFSPEECRATIELAESLGFGDAPISTGSGDVYAPEYRNNSRVMLDDVARAEMLYQRAETYVPRRIEGWNLAGVNERLRFYRYDVGQQFDWHYDGYFRRASGERSWLTFMIYLNDEFAGGETLFSDYTVQPQIGMALFFVHHVRHKGETVTRGRKYVLRTDVMYRETPRG